MPYKRTPTITSFGGFVNIFGTLAIVSVIAIGYFGAIAELPIMI